MRKLCITLGLVIALVAATFPGGSAAASTARASGPATTAVAHSNSALVTLGDAVRDARAQAGEAAAHPAWSWPVQPRPEVTRPFSLEHRYGPGHRGIDLAVTADTPIYAPDDGIVHFAGIVVDRPVLSVQHPSGVRSTFEPVIAVVAAGEPVRRGQLIAHLAAEPVHPPSGGLHLGARLGEDYLDPLALLGEVPRAILLPL